MKYKVGDKVRVRKWDDMVKEFGLNWAGGIQKEVNGQSFTSSMKEFCRKEIKIEKVYREDYSSNGWLWEDWMLEDVKPPTLEDITLKFGRVPLIAESIKIVYTHEDTIINLNELNSIKTRQIEDLMKFIAHLVPKAHKEYLSHHLNDVQLIDGIMYHVRKGK